MDQDFLCNADCIGCVACLCVLYLCVCMDVCAYMFVFVCVCVCLLWKKEEKNAKIEKK